MLKGIDWRGIFNLTDPEMVWEGILKNICSVLDILCPIRFFHIKNYRPDWMTKEVIEQNRERDYFYQKAKSLGDMDAWNVATQAACPTGAHPVWLRQGGVPLGRIAQLGRARGPGGLGI